MNYESDMATPKNIDAVRSDGHKHDVSSGGETRKNGAHQRQQRWAWTAASGHYDWMDSHGPFASLD